MMDANKENFYVSELKSALEEYLEIDKQVQKINAEKRKHTKLVQSLVSVLNFKAGEKGARELLEKNELLEMAQQFLEPQTSSRSLAGTVVRRRKGRKKIVDPENVLANGTPVRMIAGKYQGFTGKVASSQAKKVPKGLDVTYFLSLSRGRSGNKRTSVKHGTLGKTWEVMAT